MKKRLSNYFSPFVFFSDLILLNISFLLSHLFYFRSNNFSYTSGVYLMIVNISWILVSAAVKNHEINRPLVLSENLNKFLLTTIYHLLLVFGAIYFFQIGDISRPVLVLNYLLFVISIISFRSIIFFFLDYIRKKGYNKRHIIIAGDEFIGNKLKNRFLSHPEYGFHLIDFIPYCQLENISEKELNHRFFFKRPDEIFLCYTRMDENLLHGLMGLSESNFVKINIVSDLLLKDKYASLINYHELPVLHISKQEHVSLKIKILKRGFDVVFSLLVMTFGSPVFFAIYIITKLTSSGPVFYKQERVGKYGKPFFLYKFRSMHINAEPNGPQLACEHDPRITNWGKIIRRTRLDELPQFWNVFIGNMSVVGPRPERQYYLEKIIEKAPHYKDLMRIKPGITSIGQVSYGYAENVEEMCIRARYDLIYLKRISFRSDLNIILKTVKVMVQAKGK